MTRSAIYTGTIRHRRTAGPEHRFAYPIWHLLLDLDEIGSVAGSIPFLSHNRFNLLSLDDRDHFGPEPRPIRDKLAGWLADRGVALGDRPVQVLTGLRLLGHTFDPVRFYFCRDARGAAVREVVAEVRSTFDEAYAYLLSGDGGTVVRADADKRFHVSPFLDGRGIYRFRLTDPGPRLTVHIALLQEGVRVFDATLSSARRELDALSLARTLLGWSGSGARTLARIHWQALRLWRKGAPVIRKPDAPPGAWRIHHG